MTRFALPWLLISSVVLLALSPSAAAQVPDSLSYQGCLTDSGGQPVADGNHTVTFALYDHPTAGALRWDETQTVSTTDCVFDVYLGAIEALDVAFDRPLWLGITVGAGQELSPRTPLIPAPYAHSLKGLRIIPVNTPVVRTVNLIGGDYENRVDGDWHGATISGGGGRFKSSGMSNANVVTGDYGTIGGGGRNSADHRATVAGGWENVAGGAYATVGGGDTNEATAASATISGGDHHIASGEGATIGGGSYNRALAGWATIGGGGSAWDRPGYPTRNTVYDEFGTIGGGGSNSSGSDDDDPISAPYATVAGGLLNTAGGPDSYVGGGRLNRALGTASVIGGGGWAEEWTSAPSDSGNTVFDHYGTIGGGVFNKAGSNDAYPTNGELATVGGGAFNQAAGWASTVAGGFQNVASNSYATAGGGDNNRASGMRSAVGGGTHNAARGMEAVVPGGWGNTAAGRLSFAAGYLANAKHDGTFVWSSVEGLVYGDSLKSTGPNQFLIRASGGVGIGTNSPTRPLTVQGAVEIRTDGAVGEGGQVTFLDADEAGGWEIDNAGPSGAEQFRIFRDRGVNNLSSAFIIQTNGRVGIGTSAPEERLHVLGNVKANNVSVPSDARLKEQIEPIDGALDAVLRLQGVRYSWRASEYPDYGFDDRRHLGLLAQEVREVLPEAVGGTDTGTLSLSYEQIIPVLIEAIKAQQVEIEGLKARLDAQ